MASLKGFAYLIKQIKNGLNAFRNQLNGLKENAFKLLNGYPLVYDFPNQITYYFNPILDDHILIKNNNTHLDVWYASQCTFSQAVV